MLASSTDGVGTKLAIAQALDRHDTIGIDLVAMVVDDLVVVGAEPLFLTDYIATGKVVPEKIAAIVARHRRGLRAGRLRAGRRRDGRAPGRDGRRTSTTSPAPASGVVNADAVLGPERVAPGDVLIALGSSGLHSNGYSLVRHVLLERGGLALDDRPGRARRPHARRRAADARPGSTPWTAWRWPPSAARTPSRTSPAAGWPATWPGCCRPGSEPSSTGRPGRRSRSSTWSRATGDVPAADLELTFNLGVGMVAVVPRRPSGTPLAAAGRARGAGLAARRARAGTSGEPAPARCRLVGDYAGIGRSRGVERAIARQ